MYTIGSFSEDLERGLISDTTHKQMARITRSSTPAALTWLSLILTLTLLMSSTLAQESCQLLQVRERIVVDRDGMACEKDVTLNKCEGQCISSVIPSVREHHGFRKNCSCCKESRTTQVTEILTHCYSREGVPLPGRQMSVAVTKILSCSCIQCTN